MIYIKSNNYVIVKNFNYNTYINYFDVLDCFKLNDFIFVKSDAVQSSDWEQISKEEYYNNKKLLIIS